MLRRTGEWQWQVTVATGGLDEESTAGEIKAVARWFSSSAERSPA